MDRNNNLGWTTLPGNTIFADCFRDLTTFLERGKPPFGRDVIPALVAEANFDGFLPSAEVDLLGVKARS